MVSRSVCRLGDRCSGHGCFPPRNNVEACDNVFANGIPLHLEGQAWNTHCFTGETQFFCNGNFVTFEEFHTKFQNSEGSKFTTLSYFDGMVINTTIKNSYKIEDIYNLVELVLDNNTIIRCTPDHLFLLTTGEYKAAQHLTEDDEIMDNLYT